MKLIIFIFSACIFLKINASDIHFKLPDERRPLFLRKIPFVFSNSANFSTNSQVKIKLVLNKIKQKLSVDDEPCIEFVPLFNEKDYVQFVDYGDCSSDVGFYPGINNISLSKSCIDTGIIIHEMMHLLGFGHEQSRFDRDKYVELDYNFISDLNFKKDNLTNESSTDFPYDFYSIMHYNSNSFQQNVILDKQTIQSKYPSLLSNKNLYHSKEELSPIDIYKIQKLYQCKTIDMPKIVYLNESLSNKNKTVLRELRFIVEASASSINKNVIDRYLRQTYDICGENHYWPYDYPLIDSRNDIYKLICMPKKKLDDICRFSIECLDDNAVCVRYRINKLPHCYKSDTLSF